MSQPRIRAGWKSLVFGLVSCMLYFLLYTYEKEILELSKLGKFWEIPSWLFLISLAFVFSIAHGAMTSSFWDWLGVQAKVSK